MTALISLLINTAAQNELCSLSHGDTCECLLSFQHDTGSAYQNLCQLTKPFCITQSVATLVLNKILGDGVGVRTSCPKCIENVI